MSVGTVKKTLSVKDVRRHVKAECSCCCPFCGNSDISGESVEIDGRKALQDVSCGRCGAEWQDVYLLKDLVIKRSPDAALSA